MESWQALVELALARVPSQVCVARAAMPLLEPWATLAGVRPPPHCQPVHVGLHFFAEKEVSTTVPKGDPRAKGVQRKWPKTRNVLRWYQQTERKQQSKRNIRT